MLHEIMWKVNLATEIANNFRMETHNNIIMKSLQVQDNLAEHHWHRNLNPMNRAEEG